MKWKTGCDDMMELALQIVLDFWVECVIRSPLVSDFFAQSYIAARTHSTIVSSRIFLIWKKLLHNSTMQLANNSIRQTHYNILNVKEDATHEEIRSSYRSALLSSHPDKLQNTSPTTDSNHQDPRSRFLDIQTAWEILGDVKSRAVYDRELCVSRQDEVTADEVELEDLAVEAGGDVVELYHQCRCGDYFLLDSLELKEMGFEISTEKGGKISLQAPDNGSLTSIVLPCGSCSLKIRLVINKDTRP
ncbi:hypothetical protein L2E82_27092 [Cichorium intybus]|uniref:Uncharacterized protein n=1 Tax=Cichorium intybus TaxID=13427 RepID=A0ACB9CSN4_CICIN|nr:hypothetical protein L2E82_27092 [Cichorium intybus]